MRFTIRTWGMATMLAILPTPGSAQGVEVESDAVVLHGSASNTTQPATIELTKVEKKTPEYKTIKAEGVRKGSARYELLVAKMHKRIKAAAKAVAEAAGYDCVIRAGDIRNENGLEVIDLTEEVVEQLESSDDDA